MVSPSVLVQESVNIFAFLCTRQCFSEIFYEMEQFNSYTNVVRKEGKIK